MSKVEAFLREKQARGVKDVRVATVLKVIEDERTENGQTANEKLASKVRKESLVGTAEAAELLGVERPRIGRWRKAGIMPEPVAELASGPVWLHSQITAIQDERDRRRRQPSAATA